MGKIQGNEVLRKVFVLALSVILNCGEAQLQSYLINCGLNSSETVDGRKWVGDLVSSTNVTLSSSGVVATTDSLSGDSVFGPIYQSARVFSSKSNYTVRGLQGTYFVRLHFCPFTFEDHDLGDCEFDVVANGVKLVSELNVRNEITRKNMIFQSSGNKSSSFSLIKEYMFDISSNALVVEFIPSSGSSGFVNAIEVVPVGSKLLTGSAIKVGGNAVNFSLNGRAIETMYRLNVGGSVIYPNQDPKFWRIWEEDSDYMITANAGSEIKNSSNITYASANGSSVAPLIVYETARTMSNTQVLEGKFNMSWKFGVDPDFDYVIRLHFCELVYDKANQRVFRIYINNGTAANSVDIFALAGGTNKAYHQDFFDPIPAKLGTLWIQLGPETGVGALGTDALLNGLEIFKLSRSGNLASVKKLETAANSTAKSKSWTLWVGIGAGVVTVIILAAAFIIVFCFCRKQAKETSDSKKNAPTWRPLFLHSAASPSTAKGRSTGIQYAYGSFATTTVGKQFTLAEIRAATNNFDESLVIGVGGFGKVYKGDIEDGTLAAIKRANPQSQQGQLEFQTEIEMLSKLRHRHLVSLIGFCEEQNEMILVYEYMANGTLRSHLFGSDLPPLTWKQRLEACIGAARGLHYLHTGAERSIIHRDVKTTNILLDANFVAKMSDFGLSKTGPALEHTHVSTAVKGSFGYLDPEYFRRQQLTEKSDVYSFGVVLFETVCARPVINPTLPRDQINLAEWALRWERQKSLASIMDPHLEGTCSPESMEKFGEIGAKCLADEGKNRPTMGEVLWHLEYVLQLHEAWMHTNSSSNSITSSSQPLCNVEEEAAAAAAAAENEPESCSFQREADMDQTISDAATGSHSHSNLTNMGK